VTKALYLTNFPIFQEAPGTDFRQICYSGSFRRHINYDTLKQSVLYGIRFRHFQITWAAAVNKVLALSRCLWLSQDVAWHHYCVDMLVAMWSDWALCRGQ